MSFKKKLLKGAFSLAKGTMHVSTLGTTFIAEKGIKSLKRKLDNNKIEKIAIKKRKKIIAMKNKIEKRAKDLKKLNIKGKYNKDEQKKYEEYFDSFLISNDKSVAEVVDRKFTLLDIYPEDKKIILKAYEDVEIYVEKRFKIIELIEKKIAINKIIKKGFEKKIVLRIDKEYRNKKKINDFNKLLNQILTIPGINKKLATYITNQYKSIETIRKVPLKSLLETPKLTKKQAGAIKKL